MQQQQLSQKETIFIIEHMESYLYEWCLSEYLQMKEYLQKTNYHLWITNTKVIQNFHLSNNQSKESEEKEKNQLKLQKQKEQNINNWKILQQKFGQNPQKFRLIPESVVELVYQESKLQDPVCMLDMRAKQELTPGQNWGTLVFGGILGDHPPRDRPAPVRQHFSQIRHLGDLQLATDTAVLVSKLILHNKMKLETIPMIRQPTIKGQNKDGDKTTVQMEGFSYVSQELDIGTGQLKQGLSKKEKKSVYMSEGDLSTEQLM